MASWNAFYEDSEKRAPSLLLSRAIDYVKGLEPSHAVDLGCGSGNEAWQMIQAGWQVLAIDREPEAITRTANRCSMSQARSLDARVAHFEHLNGLPPSSLIHAGLSLPFCHPHRFEHVWHVVCQALVSGGVFVGHFFGLRHSWSKQKHMTFHSLGDVQQLAAGMEILLILETESPMVVESEEVNWHRIDVIVRKIKVG
ncbi:MULTISPECIES: class I SAM-dependent methyltransferase [Pseudomonas]|uniref:class I SAM-dependent methyltransferase n=1 Tax=Pseudomonas TaxID=286 RepID=UPI001B83EEA7|nr:methyltransferase domain-containing protein [Pseudomonas juntendi]MBR7522966.1 methyltransferase domain-containing protein [Pseudomonas juntendi]